MTPGPEPEPDLAAIEAALRSLTPSRPGIDRDRLLYQAGRASALRGLRVPWPAVAAALAVVAGVEGAMLARSPSTRVVERVVVVREPAPAPGESPRAAVAIQAPAPPSPARNPVGFGLTEHGRLAGQLIRYGLDGLPGSRPGGWGGGPPSDPRQASSRRLLREELRKTLRPGDPS